MANSGTVTVSYSMSLLMDLVALAAELPNKPYANLRSAALAALAPFPLASVPLDDAARADQAALASAQFAWATAMAGDDPALIAAAESAVTTAQVAWDAALAAVVAPGLAQQSAAVAALDALAQAVNAKDESPGNTPVPSRQRGRPISREPAKPTGDQGLGLRGGAEHSRSLRGRTALRRYKASTACRSLEQIMAALKSPGSLVTQAEADALTLR